jgi:hypothetical protein
VSHRLPTPHRPMFRTVRQVSRLTRITVVRRANMDRMNVDVTCACGYRWESHSASGRTRCRRCGKRVYIPLQVRQSAGLDRPTTRSEDPGVHRLGKPRSTTPASADRTTVPQLDESPFASRPEPQVLAPPARTSTWVADAIVKITGALPELGAASPQAPEHHSTPASPAPPPRAPAVRGGILILDVVCGCQLRSATSTPPAGIRCPVHGRVAVRRSRLIAAAPNAANLPFGSPIE